MAKKRGRRRSPYYPTLQQAKTDIPAQIKKMADKMVELEPGKVVTEEELADLRSLAFHQQEIINWMRAHPANPKRS